MASTWRVEAATCNEDIYPGELPVGLSRHLSRGPRSLSAAHCRPGVEPPRTCSSSKSRGPPAIGPISVQSRELPSRWTAVGPTRPRREAPIHFRPHSAAWFEFSPRARAGPEAAVVDDEGVSLPGELIRPSCCHPPPRSSPRCPWSLLRAHPV
jgi:hypothetical protein